MRLESTLLKVVILFIAGTAGLLLLPAPSVAKGLLDRIIFEGPRLLQPIEISDGDALIEFDPWARAFIDWNRGPATEPPVGGQTYRVSFYLDDRVIYVLEYAPDAEDEAGLIYIPGPEHPGPLEPGGQVAVRDGRVGRTDAGQSHSATAGDRRRWPALAAIE